MFGTRSRKSQATQVAEDAWNNLTSLVGTAGDTARTASRRTTDLADEAGSLVSSAADEAWSRASAAYDALAGRRQSLPWAWIAVAVVAGGVAGWLAATAAPKVAEVAVEKFNQDKAEDPTLLSPPATTVV